MNTNKFFSGTAILISAVLLMAANTSGINFTLTVNDALPPIEGIELEPGEYCTFEIVANDYTPYEVYLGFVPVSGDILNYSHATPWAGINNIVSPLANVPVQGFTGWGVVCLNPLTYGSHFVFDFQASDEVGMRQLVLLNPVGTPLASIDIYVGGGPEDDWDPPTPNPMEWSSAPSAVGSDSITMTAAVADDINEVEYYFDCLTPGGNDSDWQSGKVYVDTPLSPNKQYTYQVIARDLSENFNETSPSVSASATTMSVSGVLAPGMYLPYDTPGGVGVLYNGGDADISVTLTDSWSSSTLDTFDIVFNDPDFDDVTLIASGPLSASGNNLITCTPGGGMYVDLTLQTGSGIPDIGTLWSGGKAHLQGADPGGGASVSPVGGDVTGSIDMSNISSSISGIAVSAAGVDYGDFTGDIRCMYGPGSITVDGDLTGYITNALGSIGPVNVGGNMGAPGKIVAAGALADINVGGDIAVDITAANAINHIYAGGDITGNILSTSGSITGIRAYGNITGAITAVGPIGFIETRTGGNLGGDVTCAYIGWIDVEGNITGVITSSGSIGSITIDGYLASLISASSGFGGSGINILGGITSSGELRATGGNFEYSITLGGVGMQGVIQANSGNIGGEIMITSGDMSGYIDAQVGEIPGLGNINEDITVVSGDIDGAIHADGNIIGNITVINGSINEASIIEAGDDISGHITAYYNIDAGITANNDIIGNIVATTGAITEGITAASGNIYGDISAGGGSIFAITAGGDIFGTVSASGGGIYAISTGGGIFGAVTATGNIDNIVTVGGVSGTVTSGGSIGTIDISGTLESKIQAQTGFTDPTQIRGGISATGELRAVTGGFTHTIIIDTGDMAGIIRAEAGNLVGDILIYYGNMTGVIQADTGDINSYITVAEDISGNISALAGSINGNIVKTSMISGAITGDIFASLNITGNIATNNGDISGTIETATGDLIGQVSTGFGEGGTYGDISDIRIGGDITGDIFAVGHIISVAAGGNIDNYYIMANVSVSGTGDVGSVTAGGYISCGIEISGENVTLVRSGGQIGHDITANIIATAGKIGTVDAGSAEVNGILNAMAATTASPLLTVIDSDIKYLVESSATPSEAVFWIHYYGGGFFGTGAPPAVEIAVMIYSGFRHDIELRTVNAADDSVNDAPFDLAWLLIHPESTNQSLGVITIEGSIPSYYPGPVDILSMTALIVQEDIIAALILTDSINLLSAAMITGSPSDPFLADLITQTGGGSNPQAYPADGTFRIPLSPNHDVNIFAADADATTFNAGDMTMVGIPAEEDAEAYVTFENGVLQGIVDPEDLIHRVPEEFGTIQEAIDFAYDGDVVIVYNGIYTGTGNKNLNFYGKAITVRSQDNDPNFCIIDCEGSGRGFIFANGETSLSILDGFTITNGDPVIPPRGAGILMNFSSPTIRNCVVTNNSADCAAGIDIRNSGVSIDDMILTNNAALTGINSGFSQSNVYLGGLLSILDGTVEVYGGQFNGPGGIFLEAGTALKINDVPVCGAEVITNIVAGDLDLTPVYLGFDSKVWWMPSVPFSNAIVAGRDFIWAIAPPYGSGPAIFEWYGSVLEEDFSADGIAEASFLGGGQIAIYGDLYDSETQAVIYNGPGPLLVATVGPFYVMETDDNELEFVGGVEIIPTGGFLAGNELNIVLNGSQIMAMALGEAMQLGGDVEDFQSTIMVFPGTDFHIEPVSLPWGFTTITSDISGTGDIEIGAGSRLTIAGDAIVDLGGSEGCNPGGGTGGHITVNGSLVVTDQASLKNTNIDVKLFNLTSSQDIQNNNITLLEASPGFGGEFFVSGQANITCNTIISEGDRYLDLDPDPDGLERPTFSNNYITVIILEGKEGTQGTLLELRAGDYDWGGTYNPLPSSGAYKVPGTSSGFTPDPSTNWVLQKLIITEDAKLNLTNRQGFEFSDFTGTSSDVETVYVKELIMYPNAVLNTALQALYYETLIIVNTLGTEIDRDPSGTSFSNGSEFVDVPLLGFSLAVIDMNDPADPPHNEFDIRVRSRLTDLYDEQLPPPALRKEGSIDRIDEDPDEIVTIPTGYGGVMDMRTKASDKSSASSVAAKGAFARAGDESITVEFEYLFIADPSTDAELIVYLSSDPEVDWEMDPEIVKIATIHPPSAATSRPGSIGSGKFATFMGTFPRGDLNFTRGTYVQLELRGTDARCWIDNWDPQIRCISVCGDYGGWPWGQVNVGDYLLLLSEFGLSQPAEAGKGCLDLIGDGVINIDDLLAWDIDGMLNVCPQGSPASSAPPSRAPSPSSPPVVTVGEPDSLVIFGKPSGTGSVMPDGYFYTIDETSYTYSDSTLSGYDGRIVSDGDDNIYQIQNNLGLVDHAAGQVVMTEQTNITFGSSKVTVGFNSNSGCAISDIAFSPDDADIIYVVPVQVTPPSGQGSPYKAAAKLELTGSGNYTVRELYGTNPFFDEQAVEIEDSNSVTNAAFNPDFQSLHEIEVDSNGNLYVLSTNWYNDNDWIVTYDVTDPNSEERISLSDLNIPAPTAMVVSSVENEIYLATSVNASDDLITEVYRLSMVTTSGNVTGLNLETTTSITCPAPDFCTSYPSLCTGGTYITTITAMTEDAQNGILYITGFTAPKFSTELASLPAEVSGVFTTPIMAGMGTGSSMPTSATAYKIPGSTASPLALPTSAVWKGPVPCGGADFSGNGSVGIEDLRTLAEYWMAAGCVPPGGCEGTNIENTDGNDTVNLADFGVFSQHWKETGCN